MVQFEVLFIEIADHGVPSYISDITQSATFHTPKPKQISNLRINRLALIMYMLIKQLKLYELVRTKKQIMTQK